MPVPLLDVNAQNLPLRQELKTAFDRVLKSGQFIMGPDIAELENEIAAMTGAKYAIGVSSGTDAILLALMALEIGPGDEVLCPTYTFFATAGCIARAGATPIFVEADSETFNLDVADAARKVTSRTRAIMPVHLFGQCADMDAVMNLAAERNISVIEDAAQSLGAKYRGRDAGTIGTFGTYSFFPSKNLGGLGDGGMLVCNDEALAERARLLRVHGSKPKYYHKYVGANFRLDSLQAAFLRVKLAHYCDYTAKRRRNAASYSEKFGKLPKVALADDPKAEIEANIRMVLPTVKAGCDHIWNQYTVRVVGAGKRDAFREHLTRRGIGTEIYYPVPMHAQECFARLTNSGSFPCAERLTNEAVSLPIYPELSHDQLNEVAQVVTEVISS